MSRLRAPAGVLRDRLRKLLISMYVLGINGSPRKGGNTDILLEKALEGARDSGAKTEKIALNDLKFSACLECADMKDDGSCIVDDEMQLLYAKIREADVLIMASPVFFGSLSAQSKAMIDRFQCAWRARYIFKRDVFKKKKSGAFISVQAAERKDFFDSAKAIVKNFFAVVNASYKEELFCGKLEEKGDALKHPDHLKRAYELGKRSVKTEGA